MAKTDGVPLFVEGSSAKSPCKEIRVIMGKESPLKLSQRGSDARKEVPHENPKAIIRRRVKDPRRKRRGFEGQTYSNRDNCASPAFSMRWCWIRADDLRCDLVPDRTSKIAIFPKLPAPEATLHAGELTKDGGHSSS